jgi:hypothetical protein
MPNPHFSPYEHRIRSASDGAPRADAEVPDGADHIIVPHEEHPPTEREDDSAPKRAHEPLHRLFRRQLDERRAPEGDAPDVGEHVVADDERGWDPEPDQAFEDVIDDEVAGGRLERRYQRASRGGNFFKSHLETTMRSKLM